MPCAYVVIVLVLTPHEIDLYGPIFRPFAGRSKEPLR